MKLFFRPDPFKDSDGNLVQLDDIELTALHTQNDEWGTEAIIWINLIGKSQFDDNNLLIDPNKDDVTNLLQKEVEEYYNLKYGFDKDYKEIHKLLRSKKIE